MVNHSVNIGETDRESYSDWQVRFLSGVVYIKIP